MKRKIWPSSRISSKSLFHFSFRFKKDKLTDSAFTFCFFEMKKLVFLFICIFLIQNHIFSQNELNQYNTVYVSAEVDTLPSYKGGEKELYQFINENFHPSQSIKRETGNSEQVIIVNLTIDTSGVIRNILYPQSCGTMVEQEFNRVINKMPVWNPGFKNGKKVITQIHFPIRFIILNNEFTVTNSGTEMVVGNSRKNRLLKWTLGLSSIGLMCYFLYRNFYF